MIEHRIERNLAEVLANNLRRLRVARHLSLSELARATAMSKATLSHIEKGGANPTIDTLVGLAGALNVSVAELLAEPPAGDVWVVRQAERRIGRRDGLALRPLETSTGAVRGVEFAEIALAQGERRELAPKSEGTRASLYVLGGSMIAGPVELVTELASGDYLSFSADVDHAYEASRESARAMLIVQIPR